MEVVVTTWAVRRAKLQSNHHHQQINTQLFTDQMPVLSPNQQYQSTERENITLHLFTPSSPWVFQLRLWPLKAPGYLGEGCHASRQPYDASTPFTCKTNYYKKSMQPIPEIFSVPECSMEYLWSRRGSGRPLRYQRMDGSGSPVARHCIRARLLIGSVWFCGPWWMIGAGRGSSSVARTVSSLSSSSSSYLFNGYQWRRSVVKYRGQGQSDQVIKLFQITSCISMISEHSTIPVPDSL